MPDSIHLLHPHNWTSTHADALFGFAMSKTGDKDLAQDLVQDTFFSALKAMQSFKGQCSERTWLFTILKFKIADHYRKATHKYEVNSSSFHFEEQSNREDYFTGDGEWKTETAPKSWQMDASVALENKELAYILNFCMDKLPENQKQLILLKMVEDEDPKLIVRN